MMAFERKTRKLESEAKFKNCPVLFGNHHVTDFWQWAYSDLLQNITRGVLAEYIVAVLLDADKTPRNPWLPFDLKLEDGTTVEVKTMSRLQAWAQKKLSDPRVIITEKRSWDPETGIIEQTPSLNANVYVICYHTSEDQSTADPLDLDQWSFFVLNKKEVRDLLKKGKSISLKTLTKMNMRSLRSQELQAEVSKSAKKM